MIRDQRPNFMLIQEMKMKKEILGKISSSNTMAGKATNSEGASRGLLTLFNNRNFIVSSLYNEGNILLCKVFHRNSNDSWFLLNVYAPNTKRERKDYWTKLCSIIQNSNPYKGIIM